METNNSNNFQIFLTVLTLFLGFEVTIYFSILQNPIELHIISLYYLLFNILLNTLAILSILLLINKTSGKDDKIQTFLKYFSTNLIILSFIGIFIFLFYFTYEISLNVSIKTSQSNNLMIFLFFSIIIIILFIIVFFNIGKLSLKMVIFETFIWIGCCYCAYTFLYDLSILNYVWIFKLIVFLLNLIYLSIARLIISNKKKAIIYLFLLAINLIIVTEFIIQLIIMHFS